MPVRILYNEMRDVPVPLVTDMYIKTIVPNLEEESRQDYLDMIRPLKYDYKATNSEEKCIFEAWREIKNELYFTNGYIDIFKDDQITGLWVAYEALSKIFEKYPGPDYRAGYMQEFYYNRKKFLVTSEVGHVVFSTPEEY